MPLLRRSTGSAAKVCTLAEKPGGQVNTLSAVTRWFLGSALLGAAAAACRDDPASPTPTTTLVVMPQRLVLGSGMSRQLTASVVDQSGAAVPDPNVSFA